MEINDWSKKLIVVVDDKFWDSLPKEIYGLPVYCRRTKIGFDFWPMWHEYVGNPVIRVLP